MLLAMFTRTGPHPPLEVEPIALGPFLAASLAIGAAAYVLAARGAPYAMAIAFFVRADCANLLRTAKIRRCRDFENLAP